MLIRVYLSINSTGRLTVQQNPNFLIFLEKKSQAGLLAARFLNFLSKETSAAVHKLVFYINTSTWYT